MCYNCQMSINDFGKKIKLCYSERVLPLAARLKESLNIKRDIFVALVIVLIGLAGFGLGKLSALEKSREPVKIQKAQFVPLIVSSTSNTVNLNVKAGETAAPMSAAAMIAGENAKGFLVASKTGKKYHFPWCAGASQIAEKNKIWFATYDEAQKAGYTAAANCPNLK